MPPDKSKTTASTPLPRIAAKRSGVFHFSGNRKLPKILTPEERQRTNAAGDEEFEASFGVGEGPQTVHPGFWQHCRVIAGELRDVPTAAEFANYHGYFGDMVAREGSIITVAWAKHRNGPEAEPSLTYRIYNPDRHDDEFIYMPPQMVRAFTQNVRKFNGIWRRTPGGLRERRTSSRPLTLPARLTRTLRRP